MKSTAELEKSKKRGRSIPTFLKKTYEILQVPTPVMQDNVNQRVIRWANDGIGFVVLDEELFSRTVLPLYFKHSNYSSFVRQLNMYNFHKIREVEHENYFRHELFNRYDMYSSPLFRSAIEEIKRKPERKKKKVDFDSDNFSESQSPKELARKRPIYRKKPQLPEDDNKIYLEDEHIIKSEETTNGNSLPKKSETKTQSEYNIQAEDDLSIENDITDVKMEHPKLHTRDLIDCGGSAIIFPLQTGLLSIYSLASMMK